MSDKFIVIPRLRDYQILSCIESVPWNVPAENNNNEYKINNYNYINVNMFILNSFIHARNQ